MIGQKRNPSDGRDSAIPSAAQMETPTAPNAVTVFGAGVAGLTVAHELVERGFQVQVWEPQADERAPERGCDVGGLARTQWGTVPWELSRDVSQLTVPPRFRVSEPESDPKKRQFHAVRATPIRYYPYRFYIRWAPPELIRDDGQPLDYLPDEVAARVRDGVRQFDVTIAHFGVGRLTRDERERRLKEIADSWASRFSTSGVDLLKHKANPSGSDSAQPDRWYTADISLKTTPPQTVTLRVALEDSLDPNTSTTTIVPVGPNASQLKPIVLRSRWQPGEVDCTIDDTSLAMDALGEVLKSGDVWYMEAIADMRALSGEEALRRAKKIHAALASACRAWRLPSGLKLDELQTDLESGLYVQVGGTKVVVQPISAPPYPTFEDAPQDIEVAISFRPRVRWLPGEHGYRFFPSFYHHLFDTMRRIPLLELEAKSELAIAQERAVGVKYPEVMRYVETGRTAFDNLNPTTSHVLASTMRQRPSQLARSPVRSLEELRSYLQLTFGSTELGNFGLSVRDVSRLTLKLLQFATSCEDRRAEYGALSWWDYLGADTFSPEAQGLLRKWPEALVAMNAEECDARTQWVPFIQLLLDQVRKDGYRDGTLRGPTSEAWLNPWRRYLEAQGVQFIHGKLTGFQKQGDRVWPKVDCFDLRYPCEAIAEDPDPQTGEVRIRQQPLLRPGYFVVAVSSEQIGKLAKSFVEAADAANPGYADGNSDFVRAQNIGATKRELPRPKGDLRHFAGIQFYFAEDVFWIDGHVYYPDSAWQLTSISQARFWQDRMDWEHGYRGVLSVIVGTWDRPGETTNGKTAWECEPELLAREVWHQLRDSLMQRDRSDQERNLGGGRFGRRTPPGQLPEPIYWHLDQNLVWQGTNYANYAPFYIARPGRFEDRPGDLQSGYDVDFGFVLAGHHTKTYTRLPSMEGANESGRHAVNAILRHLTESELPARQFHGSFCDIWDPEDRELDDLQFFKELDQRLKDRGLPHFLESLDLDFAFEHVLRGGASDPMDPLQLLTALRRLYRRSEPRREASR